MANLVFQLLSKNEHNRTAFDCGEPILNLFLQNHANQDSNNHKSRTFVCIDTQNSQEIMGYYTLVYESFNSDDIPKKNRRGFKDNIPILLLARLAVDVNYQSQGLGQLMMFDIFKKFATSYQVAGGAGIGVNAKSKAAAAYYQRFGFIPSSKIPLQLFLPAGTIINSLTQA